MHDLMIEDICEANSRDRSSTVAVNVMCSSEEENAPVAYVVSNEDQSVPTEDTQTDNATSDISNSVQSSVANKTGWKLLLSSVQFYFW